MENDGRQLATLAWGSYLRARLVASRGSIPKLIQREPFRISNTHRNSREQILRILDKPSPVHLTAARYGSHRELASRGRNLHRSGHTVSERITGKAAP